MIRKARKWSLLARPVDLKATTEVENAYAMSKYLFVLVLGLLGAGCATVPPPAPPPSYGQIPEKLSVLRGITIGHVLEDRILALDPEHLDAADVTTLAQGPTPRIFLLHGGIYPVHLAMESFGEFLVGMGYPEAKIRDPGNGEWSYSPYDSSERIAGLVAWSYEHDAVRPMLIGHSQGGLHAVKILKELAGQRSQRVTPWNPITGRAEDRTTITDPLTGTVRPVIGTSVSYASAVGAGGWALALPHQWESLDTLRKIPDNVDEFTGYFISVDLFALSFPGNPLDRRYENNGKANVRNVLLPASYNHVTDSRDMGTGAARGSAGLGQCVRAGQGHGPVRIARRSSGARDVGRRRLVQHQEALVHRGAEPDSRAPDRARPALIAAGVC